MTKHMKEVPLSVVFTEDMVNKALECNNTEEIHEKVIKPNMEHINKVTEQENDSRYWAYAMEFAINELKLGKKIH